MRPCRLFWGAGYGFGNPLAESIVLNSDSRLNRIAISAIVGTGVII